MEHNRYLKASANIISYLFHPLIVPTIGCFIIFNSGLYVGLLPVKIMQAVYIVVFVLTFILPALIIPALYLQKFISSFAIEERHERILPLSIVAVLYGLSYYFMQRSSFPPILLSFIVGAMVCIVVCLLITVKWKISLHMTGLGGLTGLIIYLSAMYSLNLYYFLAIALIISGITATARLIVGQHNHQQVYTGFFAGLISMCLSMIIY